MGTIHNELTYSPLQVGIRRMVGGDHDVEIVRVSETLTPIVDPWSQPEHFFLRNCRRWAISVPLAANVAGIARFQLSNLQPSRSLVVVTALSVIEGTGSIAYVLTDSGAQIVAGLAPCSATDSRWNLNPAGGARPTTVQQAVDNTAAATSGIILDEIIGINGQTSNFGAIALPFIVGPGNWIQVQSTAVNHAVRFQAGGYERLALPGEL